VARGREDDSRATKEDEGGEARGVVEAVGAAGDGSDLSIHTFAPTVGQPSRDVREDALGVLAHGAGELLKRSELRSGSPIDPLSKLGASYVDLVAIEDPRECLLEEVCTVERSVVLLDFGESLRLWLREIPGILLQSEASVLDGLRVVGSSEIAHLLAAYLVERVVSEALHVKAIEDQASSRRGFRDGGDVRVRQVERDGLEFRRSFASELGEELGERLGALALPTQTTRA